MATPSKLNPPPNFFDSESLPTAQGKGKDVVPETNMAPIPIPNVKSPKEVQAAVRELVKRQKIAQLVKRIEVDGVTIDLEPKDFDWEGEKEWPIFLGFPYLMHSEEGWKVPIFDKVGELLPVYYDAETHCVVFVRSDAYAGE